MAKDKQRRKDDKPASADQRKARAVREIESGKPVDQVRAEYLSGKYDQG